MNNNVIEKTEAYHNQFRNARTDNERQVLASAYKTYYTQLTEDDKIEADKILDTLFAETQRIIEEMEPVLQQAKDKLSHFQQLA